jgi:hypothetical protein
VRKTTPVSPVRRQWQSVTLGVFLLVLGAIAIGCGGSSASPHPPQSLATIDYSPLPTLAPYSPTAIRTAQASTIAASWPVGWDTSFCTAFADITVAHQLVIDIERAIADDSRSDAQGLSDELARTAPLANDEVTGLKEWAPADQVKTELASMLDLDKQAADAYQSYFHDNVKTALKQARGFRNQVGKAVDSANAHLEQLQATGLSCSGQDLQLETF